MKLHNVIVALALVLAVSCNAERRTEVEITGQNGPEFRLHGSGTLAYFAVFSPSYVAEAREPNDLRVAIWLIAPSGDRKRVEDISVVRYGVLPNGYKQEYPIGRRPEPLVEGQQYYFHVDTRNAPGASWYVSIRGGRPMLVEGEHVCFGAKDGEWFRKPCEK